MPLLEKSHENYKGFILLKERAFFAPAVHCCYYSCFQKIIYILKEYYPDEYAKLNVNSSNSHKKQIDGFLNFYFKMNKNNAAKFKRSVSQLKDLRKRSDYGDEIIGTKELQKAEEYCKQVHSLLHKDLKIDKP